MDRDRDALCVPPLRSMADPLVARCLYSGKGYMIPLNQCMSYSELYEDIFRTFQFLPSDIIELQYSVPGCEVCFLRNDRDFQMLFCSARIHRLECVDISVLKIGGGFSRTCLVDSGSKVIDEDDYLGDAFRTEVHKTYLSDEWSSYIHHVGDKFHSAAELREKLRKYAIAVGFEFVFLRNDLDRIHAVCANVGTEGCDWHLRAFSSSANDYIDKYFHVDMLKKSYSFPIRPITNVDMSSSESASECILPPLAKRPPGRPRMKRFKSIGEVEKKLIRCGRCGKMGTHNKLSCTEPLVQQ
ncbi:uncharacterized protein LOC112177939 isoform X2 [Rosa chinensis]|uniref:uncharacterized protein LOC112177939 isoform X2 n=1 Tax=Rosa chinensis TaxID=74649 RepID=UPI001AD8D9A5|nr:uncharacterized protein LOC112177939 isoform X2 [Rosa chinensis]